MDQGFVSPVHCIILESGYPPPPPLLDFRFPVSGTWIPDSLSWNSDSKVLGFGFHKRKIPDAVIRIRWGDMIQGRICGEGAGGAKRTPCPFPQDDQHLSNTTGILQKKNLCGLLVLKSNMGRPWRIYVKLRKNGSFLVVHPLLKKNPAKNPRAAPVIII